MAAAILGYRMVLIMPEDLSIERAQTMKAFGAELILTPRSGRHGVRARPGRADGGRRQGPRARPVCQRRQPAHPLRDHRPGDLERHGRTHHAFRQRDGHHRHHHRRVALPEGAQPGGAHHRRAAQRGLAHPRHPQVARGLPAEDLRPEACRRDRARVARPTPRTWRGAWRATKACSPASPRPVPAGWRCSWRARCASATIVFVVCDRGDRYLSTGVFPA